MTLPNRELLDVPTEAPEPGAPGGLGVREDALVRSQWQLFWRRFLRHRMAVISAVVLVLIIVACFGATLFAPFSKNHQDLALGATRPSLAHWFGTDDLGRDQVTEIMWPWPCCPPSQAPPSAPWPGSSAGGLTSC